MSQIKNLVQKEWKLIYRDKKTLFILFISPIVQILILGFALSNEVKNIKLAVINKDNNALSHKFLNKIENNKFFEISEVFENENLVDSILKSNSAKSVLIIPKDFTKKLKLNRRADIQLINDATDPNFSTTVLNYLSMISLQFQKENQNFIVVRNNDVEKSNESLNRIEELKKTPYTINTQVRMLFNPQMLGSFNFVPGVLTMILMLLCTMLTSVSIVKEKEVGTMEVLLISPIHPVKIILAKVIPYLFLSILNVIIILFLSNQILEVPIKGSIILILLVSIIFILTCLSLGILISNTTDSQQSAMLTSLVGMFLPTIIFSGFMFPIENMPKILQYLSNVVPSKWYYIALKEIMIND